jgi:HlyD family secretion protein
MGLPAKVTTDSMPGQYVSGRIGYISSVSEFTPKSVETEDLRTSLVYEVRVWVDDPGNHLRLGQPVTATLETGGAGDRSRLYRCCTRPAQGLRGG